MNVVVPLVEDPGPDLVGLRLAHLPTVIDDVGSRPLAFLASAMVISFSRCTTTTEFPSVLLVARSTRKFVATSN